MTAIAVRTLMRQAVRADWDGLDIAAGLRVAVCLVVPVAVGLATGHDVAGMVAALGALNLALAEGAGNYATRARTMAAVLVGNAIAVGAGTLTAMVGWWGVPILFTWVLAAAFVGVVGSVVERTGWFAALMFMIGLGLAEPSVANAGRYAGLVALGGVWAVVVIIALWPMHPHRPVLLAVGRALVAVADVLALIARSAPASDVDRAVARAETLGHEAGAITRWHTVRGAQRPAAGHVRALALMVERARTDAVVLDHRLRAVEPGSTLTPDDQIARRTAATLAKALTTVAAALRRGRDPSRDPGVADGVREALSVSGVDEPAMVDLCIVLTVLTGTTDNADTAVPDAPARRASARVTLWSNLTPTSFWARYALRFAVAAAIGLAVGRALGLEKGYWVLITIAVVLKPQLSVSTTSTIHRVGGTILGAMLGVLIVIATTGSWALVVTLLILTVVAISVIRVNYGLGVVFVTPLVLVLLTVAHPGQWEFADARVVDTLLGAAIGLLATTAILPGSERGLLIDRARLALTGNAAYLRSIGHDPERTTLGARRTARAATDDLLAVIDRAMLEPLPLGGAYLDAATQMAHAATELWEQETELALQFPAREIAPELRRQVDTAAEHLDRTAAILQLPTVGVTDVVMEDATHDLLGPALRAVRMAADDLNRMSRTTVPDGGRRGVAQ